MIDLSQANKNMSPVHCTILYNLLYSMYLLMPFLLHHRRQSLKGKSILARALLTRTEQFRKSGNELYSYLYQFKPIIWSLDTPRVYRKQCCSRNGPKTHVLLKTIHPNLSIPSPWWDPLLPYARGCNEYTNPFR